MGKKKEKKEKKKKKKLLKKFTLERIMLFVVSGLLIITVAYIAIDSFTKSGDEEAAVAESGEEMDAEGEEVLGEQPDSGEEVSQPAASGDATPTPRRLELQPSPTPPDAISEDDPRSILDLNIPSGTASFNDKNEAYTYDTENATYEVKDGQLVGVDHEPEERNSYWSEFSIRPSGNVYAEISATNGDCIGKDSVGLVIRIDAEIVPSGYSLEVSCDGSYRLRNMRSNAPNAVFINWTPSDAINAGPFATNRLGIWGYQGKFHLFINHQHVDEFYKYDYVDFYGRFAAYVRASQTYDLSATFDDFAFWDIPFIP